MLIPVLKAGGSSPFGRTRKPLKMFFFLNILSGFLLVFRRNQAKIDLLYGKESRGGTSCCAARCPACIMEPETNILLPGVDLAENVKARPRS